VLVGALTFVLVMAGYGGWLIAAHSIILAATYVSLAAALVTFLIETATSRQ